MIKEASAISWNLDNSYFRLPNIFFRSVTPTPVRLPELVMFNSPLAAVMGLNDKALQGQEGIAVLAGNQIPEGSSPFAQAYAGHQFGHFTMLGDGRAILLGEQLTPTGQRFDIQLKGSGKTPYSRGGDGRAALGPMLREYIISEAMHALGIPTTRSLAVVKTGEAVIRETKQPGAILTRVSSSHLRVGTFQYASEWGAFDDLRVLADYTLNRHFPDVEVGENSYLALFQEVIKRQALLIAKWQLVGFIHGVMNTDNMTISGETIDYGPCAFMDTYDLSTVFSSIDIKGRYAYGNQPYIGGWNLARFAETLLPLLHSEHEQAVKLAQAEIAKFSELNYYNWLRGMRAKLGICNEEEQDKNLIEGLLSMMQEYRADYTNTFRALTLDTLDDSLLFGSTDFGDWYKLWKARLARQQGTEAAAHQLMKKSNPAIIPRNHRVEAVLEAAVQRDDYRLLKEFLGVHRDPYAYSSEQEEYTSLPERSSQPYKTYCGT
ncbi:MAG: protein ydiU [Firmicutes bacterium]|nr:protein ydiU [Bacillota bacterium]